MEIVDPIHGVLELPVDITHIIKTPQFQRLKKIKQLGVFDFFHPAAAHTRYDHCIGTYWVAKKMLNSLEVNSKWITEDDNWAMYRLAVEIAGLLHDIGHGPFSHMWESISKNYNHEWNALPCIDAIFQQLDSTIFTALRRNNNFGIALIKSLILGQPNILPSSLPVQYFFIFEIINNKRCKVDVDKWDYIKRDQHYLTKICNPDTNFEDVFLNAAVTDDGTHIQYRYEDYHKIYKLFVARWELHCKAYRNSKNLVYDYLMRQAIIKSLHTNCDKNITNIDARDVNAFLNFTDDAMIELVKNTIEYYYLLNPALITAVDISLPHDIKIESNIPAPGEVMPADEFFSFYDDETKKTAFQRNTHTIREIFCFKLEKMESLECTTK